MPVRGTWRTRQVVRRVRKRFTPEALIVMYHRVARVRPDPFRLAVTPEHFAEQMEVIRRWGYPISLGDLGRAVREGRVPRRAVVVTFDDGYVDNLHEAKPLLERYEVPATVFVASGYLNRKRGFWVDRLTDLVLGPDALPEQLVLRIAGVERVWTVENPGEPEPGSEASILALHMEHIDPPIERYRVYQPIYTCLRPLPDALIWQALDDLAAQVGDVSPPMSAGRPVSSEELRRLADGDLIEIGAHTVTHPDLRQMDEATQNCEIAGNKRALEELLGTPIVSFAYPYGIWTEHAVAAVRAAGFEQACAVKAKLVSRRSDLYRLPRFGVQNCGGDQFMRNLDRWMRA